MKQETIDRIRKFTEDREWEQFHSPGNLAKSIVIEAAELLECFHKSKPDNCLLPHIDLHISNADEPQSFPDSILLPYLPSAQQGFFDTQSASPSDTPLPVICKKFQIAD